MTHNAVNIFMTPVRFGTIGLNLHIKLGNNPKSGDFVEYITQYSLRPSDGKLCKADFISKCVELSFLTFTLSRGLLET